MTLKRLEDEQDLIKKIVEGNERAFSALFFHYLPVLQKFALKFTKSASGAEEIIQDSFLRIWLNRDKLEHVENVSAYLYKFVSNECLTYLRKTLKETKLIETIKKNQNESSNNTIESINLNEVTKIINEAIDKLPAQRKKIYLLSRQQGKSIPEIAEMLNISSSTAKNSLVTGLKSIREHLCKNGITFVFLFLIIS